MDIQQAIEQRIPVIASFSGGKDSTAMCLFLLFESGIPKEQIHIIFADTGWEHHYTYFTVLKMAELHPVQILRSKKYENFEHMVAARGIPSSLARFCTQELKVFPIREFYKTFDVFVQAKGIRNEEGTDKNGRGNVSGFEYDEGILNYSWYPIAHFSLQDVWDIHNKYNFPINKLYKLGCTRVGCFPCIFARKNEIKLIAEISPERIDIIRRMEIERKFPFFSPTHRAKFHDSIAGNGKPYASIDAIVRWSRMSTKEVRAYKSEEEELTCSSGLCE